MHAIADFVAQVHLKDKGKRRQRTWDFVLTGQGVVTSIISKGFRADWRRESLIDGGHSLGLRRYLLVRYAASCFAWTERG